MKVINNGTSIQIEASVEEMSKIVGILDKHWIINDDVFVKKLAYQLHNPKVSKNLSK